LPTRATEAGGSDIVNQLRQNADFTYNQTLATGAQLSVGFAGNKGSSSDVYQIWNPSISTSLVSSITQPLLRNRGTYINKLSVSIARSTLKLTEYDIRNAVLGTLALAENAYWDVIEARENLRVQEEYLRLAGEFLKRSERELELGAISKLDIYQPQQRYASAEIQVSRFRFQLAQRIDALRRFIGADLDPQVRTLPVELTETVAPPSGEQTVDSEGAVQRAMQMRPDLKSAIQSLDVDELRIKSATNMLRPDLALNLGYTTKGRSGMYYERENVFGGGSQITRVIPGGFGGAMDQLFGFDAPAYVFGLTLRLPLRDRRATADMADALVTKKQHILRQRSLEQSIRLDVLNAVNNLESTKAGVDLAKKSVDFAQKQVDAEQLKYDLGTTVAYFVMSAQTDLVTAQSELVRQILAYHRARITLLRNTGELLDERGIVLQ
ncbi:MAG TPA: TolC family protein, partial [Bryobacteraceae bacterium]|nr:TolC family protein [Bryobacteraceae bacterium]